MFAMTLSKPRLKATAIALAGLAVAGVGLAGATHASGSKEVQIGPVNYQQDVNGVPVSVAATTFVKVETSDNAIELRARVVGDFVDLQRKIGPIVDTFDLPRENCRSYSPNNPVVSLPTKALTFRDGTALFSVGGSVTMWECLENPIPNSKVEWELRDIGLGIKTKVPVVVTWPGSPIKTILVTQPFEAALPVSLVKRDDYSVALEVGRPDIELKGQYAFITKGILKIAGVDVNQKAHDALLKAIDPAKLRMAMPQDLLKYNPAIVSARFIDVGGHLSAEIALTAKVPASAMTDLVEHLLKQPKT